MRILIVDDHAVVRQGLRRLLAPEGEHSLAEAGDGHEALARAEEFRPHVIILDLNLPGLGGLELVRRLVAQGHGRVLVLSMHAEPHFARRSLAAGAYGYLSKNASADEVVAAVDRVSHGGRYVEAGIAQALALDDAGDDSPLTSLTPRELEILRLLAHGAALEEIGVELGITYKTVANNCALLKSKLGVSRTIDLLRLAIDTGLVANTVTRGE
jgi:DNA-binding NarL/FixJ family response regulator